MKCFFVLCLLALLHSIPNVEARKGPRRGMHPHELSKVLSVAPNTIKNTIQKEVPILSKVFSVASNTVKKEAAPKNPLSTNSKPSSAIHKHQHTLAAHVTPLKISSSTGGRIHIKPRDIKSTK
jgi:hypothetical protein